MVVGLSRGTLLSSAVEMCPPAAGCGVATIIFFSGLGDCLAVGVSLGDLHGGWEEGWGEGDFLVSAVLKRNKRGMK